MGLLSITATEPLLRTPSRSPGPACLLEPRSVAAQVLFVKGGSSWSRNSGTLSSDQPEFGGLARLVTVDKSLALSEPSFLDREEVG